MNEKINLVREIKVYTILIIFLVLTGIGLSLIIKIEIGLGPWDALAVTFSYLSKIKIGTVGMILKILCILGQFIAERKNFKKINFLQLPILILLGNIVNYFVYTVFKNLFFDSYIMKVIIVIVTIILVSFSVSVILVLGKPAFPLESFCMAVYKKINISYSKFRLIIDIAIIIVIIITTLLFSLPWSLREGTLLFAVLFGPFLGIFMPEIEKKFEKWGIVDGKSELEKKIEEIE